MTSRPVPAVESFSGAHGNRLVADVFGTRGRPVLLLHGGGGEDLLPWLPQARWQPALVLEGLARWARVVEAEVVAGPDRPLG